MSEQPAADCCATCRHWLRYGAEKYHLEALSFNQRKSPEGVEIERGVCRLTEFWFGETSWDLKPTKAIAHDCEEYSAVLHTDHDFYCNQFERHDAP